MHAMPEDPASGNCGTAQFDPSSLCRLVPSLFGRKRANNPHFHKDETFHCSTPLLVMDDCFIRNINDKDFVKCLVGKLYPYHKLFGWVVDVKGPDPFAVARLCDFIREAGLARMRVQMRPGEQYQNFCSYTSKERSQLAHSAND